MNNTTLIPKLESPVISLQVTGCSRFADRLSRSPVLLRLFTDRNSSPVEFANSQVFLSPYLCMPVPLLKSCRSQALAPTYSCCPSTETLVDPGDVVYQICNLRRALILPSSRRACNASLPTPQPFQCRL